MLFDDIKKQAQKNKINIFFDMDGTLVEFLPDINNTRYNYGQKFYLEKRPLTYIIGVAKKLSKIKNVEVHILSNCQLNEHIGEKLSWLNKNMPFLKKDNIHIICYENITFKKEDKHQLKGNFIKENFPDQICYLIEDDLKNIKETNKMFNKNIAYHVSSLIK